MAKKHLSWPGYLLVWGVLVLLTGLSYALSRAHLGEADVVVSLVIALVKTTLVVLFFMHVLSQRLLHGMLPVIALGFVALLIALVVADVGTRHTFPPAVLRSLAPPPAALPPPAGGAR